jgi:hypothetical protein
VGALPDPESAGPAAAVDGNSPVGQAQRWLSVGTSVIAPATLITTLLFYFGYVSSRAEFSYFGIDVDTIGLSTQDYAARSPQALLVPLLVIALSGATLLVTHRSIRRASVLAERIAAAGLAVGLVLLASGLILLFSFGLLHDWPPYSFVTPLVLAGGAGVTGYAARLRGIPLRGWAIVLVLIVVVTCLFWCTATLAQWSGRGIARNSARHLDRLPSVILDTRDRLFLRSPGIDETALPVAPGQVYHFRYRHLRLLIEGKDRMFLVPEHWSASNSTLVMPLDDSVRVQFQFVNDPP